MEVDEGNFADLCLKMGWDVAISKDVIDGFLDEFLDVFECEMSVGAIFEGLLFGVNAIEYRIDYCLNNFKYFKDAVE